MRGRSTKNRTSSRRLARLTDLFFEAGMLRHTPRSGWQFLGQGKENVADHSFRVAFMSYCLAKMTGADPCHAALLGLFHDLQEARTGDLNYENQLYGRPDERRAMADSVNGTGMEEILDFYDEFEARSTPEALIAKDCDQLDLIFNLKEELDKGCQFAREWLASALERLRTPEARAVAECAMRTDHNRWWYGRVDRRWWVDRRKDHPSGKTATASGIPTPASAPRAGRCAVHARSAEARPRAPRTAQERNERSQRCEAGKNWVQTSPFFTVPVITPRRLKIHTFTQKRVSECLS